MDALLERFCRYVRLDTTSVADADRYPSSDGQLALGKLLAEELQGLGLADARMDGHGIVMATVPGTVPAAPTIAWLAHMDTSPEASGQGVTPVIHRNYDGRDIVLAADPARVIRVADTPALAGLVGKTLVTSDGTTLLGADDKAGIAIIVTAVERLLTGDRIEHGPIRVVFTCDEEVARGTDMLDVGAIGARCGYTLDAEGQGLIENETFSADQALVTVRGVNIHPGLAKDKMVNAIRVAADFVARLPADRAPETTSAREGFIHPYTIEGGVAEATVKVLLRSFRTDELAAQAEILRDRAREVQLAHPGAEIHVAVEPQYRNMVEALASDPRAVDLAVRAFRNVGVEPRFHALRGGTDGARLSEAGLPTPNLSAAMHNYHSPLEFACLEEMETAVAMLVELGRLWGAER